MTPTPLDASPEVLPATDPKAPYDAYDAYDLRAVGNSDDAEVVV